MGKARLRATGGEFKDLLSQGWSTARLAIWLCGLPLLLRLHTLPTLLKRLTSAQACQRPLSDMEQTVRVVVWMCGRRPFRWPIFARPCLRQSLALYYVLTRLGYPVEIHFGVCKQGEDLRGHSWVTVQGKLIAEEPRLEVFKVVYSYPQYDSPRGA